ncbi:hypothetical protein L3Y34_015663 [Caenorhabditis briggsae]|uniref:peptidylprolyl isomerase n=1 Tax=Caenorhabditis briggsae TaxID=6238 RepID=A0AAE9IZ80_CAEBR|nr:hypothetical protein L3Y34_015663 [Caenorhabditis briggsae]
MAVLMETTLGDLIIDLFVKERPRCSLNFIKLCKKKYYNLNQFHSIEKNYVAQTGDPTGTGKGGESVYSDMYGEQGRYFEREDLPKMRHTRMGIVSFVNNGDNMLGSQFFITLGENLDYLDDQHTIFGQVTEGIETLEKLNEQLTDTNNKPFRDIRISHTIILDDPFEEDTRISYPPRSPSPTYEMLVKTDQIALDEKEDEDEGKTAEEIAEELQQREMAEQAQILEMVGDLRDADEVPPENVLFVCKLNPVTTDEDLEIIFSRFGKINNCEIVRDRRSGDSLQYAFIEFDNAQSCEQAYSKMDNVLIDDRRIHVDFSQSVSQNYKYKPKSQNGEPQKRRQQSPPRRQEVKRSHERSPSPRRRRSPSPKRDRRNYERRDSDRRRRSSTNDRDGNRNRGHQDSHRERDRRDNALAQKHYGPTFFNSTIGIVMIGRRRTRSPKLTASRRVTSSRGQLPSLAEPLPSPLTTGRHSTLGHSGCPAFTKTTSANVSLRLVLLQLLADRRPHLPSVGRAVVPAIIRQPSQVDVLKGKVAAMEKDIMEKDERLQIAKETAVMQKESIGMYKERLEVMSTKVDALNVQVDVLKTESSNLKAEDEQKKVRIGELTSQLNEKESIMRKLHNDVVDLRGTIRVVVRVRQMLRSEVETSVSAIEYPTINSIIVNQGSKSSGAMTFEKVFTPIFTQSQVFCEIEDFILSALHGYNVGLIAFGQTGSVLIYLVPL